MRDPSTAQRGVAAAFGTALLLAAIYRVGVVRRLAMELMHGITGQ